MQTVINFLLSTEIIPLCLRTMEMGTDLSRTVATFIVQKILTDELGLTYICATPERFFAVGAVCISYALSYAACQAWIVCSYAQCASCYTLILRQSCKVCCESAQAESMWCRC